MTPALEQRQASARGFRKALRLAHESNALIDSESMDRAELVFNLSRLMNRLSQDFEALHRKTNTTWSGFRIMNVLWACGGNAELRDVARMSGASKAAVWSALKTLERDGLVSRARELDDKRLVIIKLTEAGLASLRPGITSQADRERQWFDILTADERDCLSALLAKLSDRPSPGSPTTAELAEKQV